VTSKSESVGFSWDPTDLRAIFGSLSVAPAHKMGPGDGSPPLLRFLREVWIHSSSDEIHLVDHTTALPASDTDEYPLVQPVEVASPGLDLDRGTKGVFGCVDSLPTSEALENSRAPMTHASRPDIEHISFLGFQRVADVAEHSAIRKNRLPIGAGSRQQRAAQLRPAEGPAGHGNDAPVTCGDLADVLGIADKRLFSLLLVLSRLLGPARRKTIRPP
jgi:hypothetical protein